MGTALYGPAKNHLVTEGSGMASQVVSRIDTLGLESMEKSLKDT